MNILSFFNYYGTAVYRGDKLLAYWSQAPTASQLAKALGFEVKEWSGHWEDMPMSSDKLSSPPDDLTTLQNHLNAVDRKKKKSQLAQYRHEIAQLEKELSVDIQHAAFLERDLR